MKKIESLLALKKSGKELDDQQMKSIESLDSVLAQIDEITNRGENDDDDDGEDDKSV